MRPRSLTLDPRYFQILFQTLFLAYGILFLDWKADWPHYLSCIGGCLIFNYTAESIRQKKSLPILRNGVAPWVYSAMISALSLCLLLKTNHWYTSLFAAFLTIVSKYLFRIGKKHLFNPSGFGIVATLLLTHDAWLSPGQWGTDIVLLFLILTFGAIVVTRVQKLDSSLSFLLTFSILLYWRQVFVLGWPLDHFFHSINTGSLLLFGFFMISDPKTSPNHPVARIAWAMLIAGTAFYLSAFKWLYNTPIWVLVAAAPLVPLLDLIFKSRSFEWAAACRRLNIYLPIKKPVMNTLLTKKIAASFILLAMISQQASAFCGFYVSKADGTLKNKTSQVIIVHDGNRNVITMYNDFKGNQKDFAMVVPVPVVLKESDIRVVDPVIFKTLNEYSQPRLVEYYDENPCEVFRYKMDKSPSASQMDEVVVSGMGIARQSRGVTIEAKYLVGEYDILILSAKESSGLQTWLTENGYKIPDGANEVLEPYIKSNLKFFVVKVNEKEKKKLGGNFLRPIQISFESPKFMLPIRLGMANAESDQDMIVYAFSKSGRIECANYRTVALPTGKNIPLFVQNNFNNFYANVFQHQWGKEGKSVAMLEYAWDLSPKNYLKCDPCIATVPSTHDIVQAGVWWLGKQGNDVSDENVADYSDNVYFTRLHIRYNRSAFPQDLLFEETANTENFQARYVITHPATGDLSCMGGKAYLNKLKQRRKEEMENLASLTGKGYSDWDMIANAGVANGGEEQQIPKEVSYRGLAMAMDKKDTTGDKIFYAALGLVGILSFARRPFHHKKSRPV